MEKLLGNTEKLTVNLTMPAAWEIIKQAIKEEAPFAYSKYGDGESHILNTLMGYPPGPHGNTEENFQYLKAFFQKIVRNWKTDPHPILAVSQISVPILESLVKSDLLGLYPTLPAFPLITKPNYKACSEGVLHNGPAHPGHLDDFFQGKNVRIFSQYGKQLQERVQPRTKSRVTVSQIPFTWSLRQVQDFIASVPDFPEPLVLWGGGGGTKNLGVCLRDRFKKTCVDIGSIADAWAGNRTRRAYGKKGKYTHLVIEKP